MYKPVSTSANMLGYYMYQHRSFSHLEKYVHVPTCYPFLQAGEEAYLPTFRSDDLAFLPDIHNPVIWLQPIGGTIPPFTATIQDTESTVAVLPSL
jgi:hypothetical protein